MSKKGNHTPQYSYNIPLQVRALSLVYNIFLWLYLLAIWVVSFFDKKAVKWVEGRRGLLLILQSTVISAERKGKKLVWMHCASAGEFEMGRPVLELLKKRHEKTELLVTFFSPSGFELRKNDPLVDWVFYLPLDGRQRAKVFLDAVRPDLVIFVQYEFWFHYLKELKFREIPTFLVSAHFRREQPFFKWYGALHRFMLSCFTKILVKDEASKSLLAGIGLDICVVIGNTRIDRVLDISNHAKPLPLVEKFCRNNKVLICGSTWPEDEELIIPLTTQLDFADWLFIIAPHEISPKRINELSNRLVPKAILYSELAENEESVLSQRILLIDNIGLLATIYQYGSAAYVGGGFGKGIHSILEPAAYGLPLFFGPNHDRFPEASELIISGAATVVNKIDLLQFELSKLNDETLHKMVSEKVTAFMNRNKGASEKAVEEMDVK